jgi:hypothetical protein
MAQSAAVNRAFNDALWRVVNVPPRKFNTWPLLSQLAAAAPDRLEIGPGMRPRLPIEGTHFIDLSAPPARKHHVLRRSRRHHFTDRSHLLLTGSAVGRDIPNSLDDKSRMELSDLDHEERIALVGLVELVMESDANVSKRRDRGDRLDARPGCTPRVAVSTHWSER